MSNFIIWFKKIIGSTHIHEDTFKKTTVIEYENSILNHALDQLKKENALTPQPTLPILVIKYTKDINIFPTKLEKLKEDILIKTIKDAKLDKLYNVIIVPNSVSFELINQRGDK